VFGEVPGVAWIDQVVVVTSDDENLGDRFVDLSELCGRHSMRDDLHGRWKEKKKKKKKKRRHRARIAAGVGNSEQALHLSKIDSLPVSATRRRTAFVFW
jgi:hypothetical protein